MTDICCLESWPWLITSSRAPLLESGMFADGAYLSWKMTIHQSRIFPPGNRCFWQTSALNKKTEQQYFSEVRGLHFRVTGISFCGEAQHCSKAQTPPLNGAKFSFFFFLILMWTFEIVLKYYYYYFLFPVPCVFVCFSIWTKRNPCQWNRKSDFKSNSKLDGSENAPGLQSLLTAVCGDDRQVARTEQRSSQTCFSVWCVP